MEFTRKHDYLICVDSDGCAMATMDSKHMLCFGPCMVEEWNLQPWQDKIQEQWNKTNLYSMNRGINRFQGLAVALEEVDNSCRHIPGLEALLAWTASAPELSNQALAGEIPKWGAKEGQALKKALSWSEKVNVKINALPKEILQAFDGVKEALEEAKKQADVAVVSSANRKAVEEEWERCGLLSCTDILLTQNDGSKAHCISELLKLGYEKTRVMMIGDAPGDEKAAGINGILFFPVLVKRERESWEKFRTAVFPAFIRGECDAGMQDGWTEEFHSNLKG